MESVRELCRQFIDSALHTEAEASAEDSVSVEAGKLSPEDRGLFQEITRGSLREWHFLSWAIHRHAERKPSHLINTIIHMSAYQLLFMDRVPSYAIFSEARKIGEAHGVSEPEQKFIHAILKAIETNKAKLTSARERAMAKLQSGETPKSDDPGGLEWAVLNCDPPLLDAFTIVEEGVNKKEARVRAVKALLSMKEHSELVGYVVPASGDAVPTVEYERLGSEIAPRAVRFVASENLRRDLTHGLVRIQGEASQWACELAAAKLRDLYEKRGGESAPRLLRVLEMASGKGGKLAGTLAAWTGLAGGNPDQLPGMEWIAVDSSHAQLEFLEHDTIPKIQKIWPQVMVDQRLLDWKDELPDIGDFDFVWLDAPCTGFGTLGKLPQIALKRGARAYDEAERMAGLQYEMLEKGFGLLAPDSNLLYTVCTLTRPETLDLVSKAVSEMSKKPVYAKALWPGQEPAPAAEGFFLAMF